ncbi:MAG: alpha/beta hydrolase [Chryseolinea sp.]
MNRFLFLFMFLFSTMVDAQQREIHLYEGAAPGSENWTWTEGINNKNSANVMCVYNVVHPTLTIFSPEPAVANGTAIIIAPGGGFHFLAIDHEGSNIAKHLVKKGVTVFVLKYRLFHIKSDNPFDDMINSKDPKSWDDEALPVIPLAIADGRKAISYVRAQAKQYNVRADRIGIMGFSAGGLVAAATSFGYNDHNRPDFVAPIYADMPEVIQGNVLTDAPPMFLACTQDDEFGFATHAIRAYNKWYEAKRPVEMHLFTTGGHGFGIGNTANTTGNWIDKFVQWLTVQGLMKSK